MYGWVLTCALCESRCYPIPPQLPPPTSHAPVITISTSTYAADLASLIAQPQIADIMVRTLLLYCPHRTINDSPRPQFRVQDSHIPAHRAILSTTSSLFRRILLSDDRCNARRFPRRPAPAPAPVVAAPAPVAVAATPAASSPTSATDDAPDEFCCPITCVSLCAALSYRYSKLISATTVTRS